MEFNPDFILGEWPGGLLVEMNVIAHAIRMKTDGLTADKENSSRLAHRALAATMAANADRFGSRHHFVDPPGVRAASRDPLGRRIGTPLSHPLRRMGAALPTRGHDWRVSPGISMRAALPRVLDGKNV